jgi:hypothetical protein
MKRLETAQLEMTLGDEYQDEFFLTEMSPKTDFLWQRRADQTLRPTDIVVLDAYRCTRTELEPGALIVRGPYRLRMIERDFLRRYLVCVPDNAFGKLNALRLRVGRWLEGVGYRLILTAEVWDMASVDRGSIPSWRDVHVLRRLFGGKSK